jgi:transcriptional regulator with XRE-family HTH domain
MPRLKSPDPDALALGRRVRALREEKGLTVEKLAYESDLGSKGHLSDIENGRVRTTVHTLGRLAERLGVDVVDFVVFPDSGPRHRLIARTRFATEDELAVATAVLPERAPAFRKIEEHARRPAGAVPLLALAVAAGDFRSALLETETWVVPFTRRRPRSTMFVARADGTSMEPLIPDGHYALFDANVRGALHGRILLVQRGGLTEGEAHAAEFTIKRFEGTARLGSHGALHDVKGRLLAMNPAHRAIALRPGDETRVIAELVTVLPEE